jgi:hypothetical protein
MAETSSPQTLPISDNFRQLEEFETLSKLRQAYKVTDVEKATLLKLASGAEAEASSVDTEITRLRAVLLKLENTRASLLKAANQARSLVAPIRKLPPEILVEIFFLASSSIHFSGPSSSIADRAMSTGLPGKVCSSWRDIAISTRKLWSSITITVDHQDLPQWALQRLEEVLELSGNALLDLTVKIRRTRGRLASTAVFTLIHKHSRRWKHLTVEGASYHLGQFFRTDLSADSFNSEPGTLSLQLPSLSRLDLLTVDTAENDEDSRELCISSTSAPNLCYVSTRRAYLFSRRLLVDLPWEQLDTLMLDVDHLFEFFNALSKSTSVTRVCLYGFSSSSVGQTQSLYPISSNTLACLQFRLVDRAEYDAMSICFDKFTLPNLQELHVYANDVSAGGLASYYQLSEWPVDSFKAFVERSGFPITSLKILRIPMRDSTLIVILECLPRLEELVIEEPGIECFIEGAEAEEYELSCLTNHLLERLQVHIRGSAGRIDSAATSANAHASPSGSDHEAGDSDSARKADPFLPYLRKVNLKGKASRDNFSFYNFLKMVQSRRVPAMAHPAGSISILKTVELRVREQPVDEAIRKEIDGLRLSHDDLVLDVVSDYAQMDSE